MRQATKIVQKIKPGGGFSHIFHVSLLAVLPVLLLILVSLDFATLALGLVVLSKWRMFAVKPRFWLVNIRANLVDLLVGFSVVLFMAHDTTFTWQIAWTVGYTIWLTVIKPGSTIFMNALQAMIALLLSMMALYLVAGDAPLYVQVAGTAIICYGTAHHFLTSFDEPYTKFLSNMWAFMGATVSWVLGHWLLYYGILSQPTLIIVVLGYGLAGLYYFDHRDKLSRVIKLEFAFIVAAIVFINIVALAISGMRSSII